MNSAPTSPAMRGSNHVGMRQFNERIVLQAAQLRRCELRLGHLSELKLPTYKTGAEVVEKS